MELTIPSSVIAMALLITGCMESRDIGAVGDGDSDVTNPQDGGEPDGHTTDPENDGGTDDLPDAPTVDVPLYEDETGTCAAPLILGTVGTRDENGAIWFLGSTHDGRAELGGTCQEKTGKENVLLHTAPGDGTLVITTSSERTDFDTVLYVRSACDDGSTELACDDDSGHELQSRVSLDVHGGEPLFIIVDSIEGAEGVFELSLSFEPTPATGETCADAIPLAFADDTATASGDTSDADNDLEASCSSEGPERFYTFTLTEPQAVEIYTESDEEFFDMVLHLWNSCNADEELYCGDENYGGEEVLVIPWLDEGTYFLAVDGYFDSDEGPYDLGVILNPTSPSCEHPLDLAATGTIDENGVLRYHGNTHLAASELEGSCGLGNGREEVLGYTAAEEGLLLLSTEGEATEFDTVVYAMGSCDDEDSELACDDDSGRDYASFLQLPVSAGEMIQVVVDGSYSDEYGAFELTAELITDLPEPVTGGEDESSATPLIFAGAGTLIARGEGSTVNATDDEEGSCLYYEDGADQVYSFTLDEERNVRITLEPEEYFDVVLYVRSSTGQELECQDTYGQEDISLNKLPAGTYYVIVDGYTDDEAGHYELFVTVSATD